MDCATYMCEEIVIEILSRLPVKSLVRFMAVCRLWKTIITSPQFRLDSKRPTKFLVHTDVECYFLVEEDGYQNCLTFETDLPFTISWKYKAEAIGSDNGLLCIGIYLSNGRHKFYNRVIIWNPLIRKHVVVIPDDVHDKKISCFEEQASGFGGTTSGDYKYVRVVILRLCDGEGSSHAVDIYSLKAGTWRRKYLDWDITQGMGGTFRTCALLRGRLHWIGGFGEEIYSFELEDEVFDNKIIMLPESIQTCFDAKVTVITESLAVITSDELIGLHSSTVYVWVMKEYDNVNSWIKLFNIVPQRSCRVERNLVHLMKDGEVFLGLRGVYYYPAKLKLVTYSPKTMKTCDFGDGSLSTWSEVRGFTYKESLVLLGDHRALGNQVPIIQPAEVCLISEPEL